MAKFVIFLLFFVGMQTILTAQTYTSVNSGNWTANSTWGGSAPPSKLTSGMTVNINHAVTYNLGADLEIEGGRVFISNDTLRFPNNGNPGTGRSVIVKSSGPDVGLLSVSNGGIIIPVYTHTGSNNSGNIKAEGGRLLFINSYAEMGQNWEATSGSHRKFLNSCLKLGENYSNINSTDTLQGVCVILGLHGSGNFSNDGGTIRFNTTAVLLRGASGNFTNSSSPNSQILTFGSPGAAIIVLDLPGNLENNATWDATVGDWCVDGSVSGSQAGQIDFINAEDCAFVNGSQCDCEPLGSPLPVKFSSFTASRLRSDVLLKWETATEEHNEKFNVQRKAGNSDWTTVGSINSKAMLGNSHSPLKYELTDFNNTIKGISQYRIEQVDLNGKASYSVIRSVRGDAQHSGVIVFPNPSNDGHVTVIFEDKDAIRNVSLMDANGRMIKQWKNIMSNTLQINNLAIGFYTLRIVNTETDGQVVEKIVVKNR